MTHVAAIVFNFPAIFALVGNLAALSKITNDLSWSENKNKSNSFAKLNFSFLFGKQKSKNQRILFTEYKRLDDPVKVIKFR